MRRQYISMGHDKAEICWQTQQQSWYFVMYVHRTTDFLVSEIQLGILYCLFIGKQNHQLSFWFLFQIYHQCTSQQYQHFVCVYFRMSISLCSIVWLLHIKSLYQEKDNLS